MTERATVAGVGMVPFATPSKSDSYDVLAVGAVKAALADAGIDLAAIQQAYAGYVYGDSTSGQNALYRVGMTGIPVINVNNNCSTGSSALFLARQAVASGAAGLRAGPRIRADAAGRAQGALGRPAEPRSPGSTRRSPGSSATSATSRRRRATSVGPGPPTATSTAWTRRCSRRSR